MQWIPHRFGWFMMYVDASYKSDELKSACPMAMWDNSKQVVISTRMVFCGITCPFHVELRAL